jgi:hypothetical protein
MRIRLPSRRDHSDLGYSRFVGRGVSDYPVGNITIPTQIRFHQTAHRYSPHVKSGGKVIPQKLPSVFCPERREKSLARKNSLSRPVRQPMGESDL